MDCRGCLVNCNLKSIQWIGEIEKPLRLVVKSDQSFISLDLQNRFGRIQYDFDNELEYRVVEGDTNQDVDKGKINLLNRFMNMPILQIKSQQKAMINLKIKGQSTGFLIEFSFVFTDFAKNKLISEICKSENNIEHPKIMDSQIYEEVSKQQNTESEPSKEGYKLKWRSICCYFCRRKRKLI